MATPGTDHRRESRFVCADCGHDTRQMEELYMVNHDLWEAAVTRTNVHMACIGCLEARIGRRLQAADFLDCPLNTDPAWRRSLRLQHRLRS